MDPAVFAAFNAHVSAARFTPVRIREGYDMAAVDDLLDSLVVIGASGGDVQKAVAESHLPVVRLREGYAIAQVDTFLKEFVRIARDPEGLLRGSSPYPPHSAYPPHQTGGWWSRFFGRRSG